MREPNWDVLNPDTEPSFFVIWGLIHDCMVGYPHPTLPSRIRPLAWGSMHDVRVGNPPFNRSPRVSYPARNPDRSLRI